MAKAIQAKEKLLSILIVIFSLLNTQAQELYFKKLNVESGLSQEDVSTIVQDSFGFIWIGTYDGLNRFDGRNIETFHRQTTDSASLPDNRINALIEDDKKRLWIGSQTGFFSYYSLLSEQFIRVKSPKNVGEIRKFIQADDHTLYALTSKGILKLIETPNPEFEFIPNSQSLHFNDAIQMPNGKIYLAGYSGVFYLDRGELEQIPNPDKTLFTSIARVDTLLIAGGNTGIYSIDKTDELKKLNNRHLKGAPVTDIISDREENIWIGTEYQGLFKFDKSLNFKTHLMASHTELRGLLSNNIQELYLDQSNNLWVGSRQGICYTSLSNVGFNRVKLGNVNGPNIRNILINEDDLIIGIQNKGLFVYDFQGDNLKSINVDNVKYVSHIEKFGDSIYVSSNRGLLSFSKDYTLGSIYRAPGSATNEPSIIRCLAKGGGNGHIYIGTYRGLLLKTGNEINWIWENYPFLKPLSGYFVFRMLYDPIANQLLIGTRSKGLVMVELNSNGQFSGLITKGLLDINGNLISNASVWAFHQARDKTVWLGTDMGVFRREPNTKLFQQLHLEGILDKKVMSIAEDSNGKLWLSSTHGLIHFDPKSDKIKTYTYEDGLFSSSMTEASGYYREQMFFGTTNGLNFINPSKISTSHYHPKLLLSYLKVNNELVKPGVERFGSVILNENINATSELSLNHLQNNFSLGFSATNFSNTSRNNFRYLLNGYDSKWVYASSNNVISYSNLDPGEYLLEIQIEDNNGKWTKNGFILPINIQPATWKTPLAYVLYFIIASALIIVLIYFWYLKQKLNHQLELDQIKISQDKELREKQLRFFVDVGHEFKTPLSLILAPFKDLTNEDLSIEQKNKYLQIVSRNIDRMNLLVNQLLDLGKITEGQSPIKVIKKDLRQSIREYAKAFEWQVQHENIDLRLNLNECIGYFDGAVLEKGFYNVLSNAFKFTPAGGVVDISLKVKTINGEDFAIISVSDSGPGIPDNQKAQIFERFYHGKNRSSSGIGLHLAKSLLQAHGGIISVEDSDFGGALFKITLPVSISSYSDGEIDSKFDEITLSVSQKESYKFNEDQVEKGETILIVEDDYELRNYLSITLQNDYSILEASNGQQGLSMTQEKLPDIIISDIMMPLMDGIEMCQKLKSNKDTSHIPILFLTAKNDDNDLKTGLKAGAWDYIIKPFDSEALRRKVINILETRNRFKKYLLNHNINIDIESHYTSYDQKLIKDINKVIEDNISNPNFNASELASEVGLSRMHLHRKLKTLAGETAKNIITRVKILYAVDMFDKGCDRVQEAMNAVGMANYGNFNNNFKKIMNVTATEYIANLKEQNFQSELRS